MTAVVPLGGGAPLSARRTRTVIVEGNPSPRVKVLGAASTVIFQTALGLPLPGGGAGVWLGAVGESVEQPVRANKTTSAAAHVLVSFLTACFISASYAA
jgi:hypothetical protein